MLANNTHFETMDYVSKILWHFVRSNDKASSTSIFLEKILSEDGKLIRLQKDPLQRGPYNRSSIIKSQSLIDTPGQDQIPERPISVKEPRAVCWADIPFNFLPIHLARYNGIGIGLNVEALKLKYPSLRPAWYIPHIYEEDITELFSDTENYLLKNYIKVGSVDDEDFNLIYREREWKIPSNVDIESSELISIIVQNEEEKTFLLKDSRIKELLSNGVSVISFHEFFFEQGMPHD